MSTWTEQRVSIDFNHVVSIMHYTGLHLTSNSVVDSVAPSVFAPLIFASVAHDNPHGTLQNETHLVNSQQLDTLLG